MNKLTKLIGYVRSRVLLSEEEKTEVLTYFNIGQVKALTPFDTKIGKYFVTIFPAEVPSDWNGMDINEYTYCDGWYFNLDNNGKIINCI